MVLELKRERTACRLRCRQYLQPAKLKCTHFSSQFALITPLEHLKGQYKRCHDYLSVAWNTASCWAVRMARQPKKWLHQSFKYKAITVLFYLALEQSKHETITRVVQCLSIHETILLNWKQLNRQTKITKDQPFFLEPYWKTSTCIPLIP